MERTEPVLVPQWLKTAGNVHGGDSPIHHSDEPSSVNSARNRSFGSNSEKDNFRFVERNSSFNFRLGSVSNGSAKHPYSSFTRSHRDKNCDGEKEKSFPEDVWSHDSSDSRSSILIRRDARNPLTRSQSMVSRKTGDVFPRRAQETRDGISFQNSTNGALSGASVLGNIKAFEKDFPSLGAEDKNGVTAIRRIMSPRLTSPLKSLPIGNTGFLGAEKWTSALAEVPVIANNRISRSPFHQSSAEKMSSESGEPSPAGRNMADALSQPAERARATPQLPDKSQRLEELAIRQSRQLIPMTPSMPKSLIKVPSSVDKSRQPKVAVRTNETSVATRGIQPLPHSSQLSNQSRAVQVRSDSSTAPHVGKFLILKPGRENGPTNGAKDASSSTSSTGDAHCRITNGQPPVGPATPTLSVNPKSSMISTIENKADALSLRSKSARSRVEFFNLMRKKTSSRIATEASSPAVLSPIDDSSGESFKEGDTPLSSRAIDNKVMILDGDGHDVIHNVRSFSDDRDSNLSGDGAIYIDEEEAAFLRSLGWEESGGEDEGLTEEEIKAFYEEYMSRRPSSEHGSSLSHHST